MNYYFSIQYTIYDRKIRFLIHNIIFDFTTILELIITLSNPIGVEEEDVLLLHLYKCSKSRCLVLASFGTR